MKKLRSITAERRRENDFFVERTGLPFSIDPEKQPCKEAKQITVRSDRNNSDEKIWIVEINTLEELIAFRDRCNEEIIIRKETVDGFPALEIYDSWRE